MKVLHVMTHFSVSSGVARLVASLIPFQIEQGHKVDVAVLADSPLTYAEEMKKVRMWLYTIKRCAVV